ncbi:hypothetical protein [Sphaerisporangium dianthi]|uniref:DUF35 domain-containing protein n=1 Tax=Sphaerisporangium dianthi TaxID=1436120 RepID=A0ABV9CS49_9ACTN
MSEQSCPPWCTFAGREHPGGYEHHSAFGALLSDEHGREVYVGVQQVKAPAGGETGFFPARWLPPAVIVHTFEGDDPTACADLTPAAALTLGQAILVENADSQFGRALVEMAGLLAPAKVVAQ